MRTGVGGFRTPELLAGTRVDALSEAARRGGEEPGQRFRGVECGWVMPNKLKPKTAIYHPPKKGMPYLVVTVSPEGVVAIAVESKEEARVLASKKTLMDDNRAEQQP